MPPNPAPPVIPPVEALPPVPDTADMLEREKATVLLTWLTRVDEIKAESVNEVETLRRAVADTHLLPLHEAAEATPGHRLEFGGVHQRWGAGVSTRLGLAGIHAQAKASVSALNLSGGASG